jgi:hypothetical protein
LDHADRPDAVASSTDDSESYQVMPGAFSGVGVGAEQEPVFAPVAAGRTDERGETTGQIVACEEATENRGGDQIPAYLHDRGTRDDEPMAALGASPGAARVSSSIARAHEYLGGMVKRGEGRPTRLTLGATEGIRGMGECRVADGEDESVG